MLRDVWPENQTRPYPYSRPALACSRLSVIGAYRMRPGDVRRAGSGRERGKVNPARPAPARPAPAFSMDPTDREPGTG